MTEPRLHRLVAAAMLILCYTAVAAPDESAREHTSRGGHFRLTWASEIEPLAINRMHRWTIRLTTPDGEPLDNAKIRVTGGMPLHNHGLPSSPRVTEALGDGRYRLAGMRFHMLGEWELVFNVESGQHRDIIVVPLKILQ